MSSSYLPKPTPDFQPAPAGTHLGICIKVIDLGTQQSLFDDKLKHQIRLHWELTNEPMRDGRPFVVAKTYTWTMSTRGTLRQHLEAWRGQPFSDRDFDDGGFDIKNLLGKACLVTITQEERDGQMRSNVSGIGKLMKGQQVPPVKADLSAGFVWLDPALFDQAAFDALHEKTREQIAKSPEYQALISGKPASAPAAAGGGDDVDDIPF